MTISDRSPNLVSYAKVPVTSKNDSFSKLVANEAQGSAKPFTEKFFKALSGVKCLKWMTTERTKKTWGNLPVRIAAAASRFFAGLFIGLVVGSISGVVHSLASPIGKGCVKAAVTDLSGVFLGLGFGFAIAFAIDPTFKGISLFQD